MKPATHDLWLIVVLTLGMIMVGSISAVLAGLSLGVAAVTFVGHCVAQRAGGVPFIRAGGGWRLVRRLAARVGATWGLALLATAVMSSAVGGMILTVVTAIVALVVWRLRPRDHDASQLADDSAELARAISLATNAQLAELWRRSASALQRPLPPAAMMRYVEIRRLILDEAERRAPERVSAWLTENPRTDSLHGYLR